MPLERPLLAVLTALVVVANAMPGDSAEWRHAAITHGELWRLWTGQFGHWSVPHLAGNLAALAAVSLIGGMAMRRWLAALPLVAPLLSLFLLLAAPELDRYRGMSGLVGVLVVGAAVEGGVAGRLLGLAYVGKLAFDALGGGGSALLPAGIEVAWTAHLGGLLIGAALVPALRRRSGAAR